MQYQQPKSHEEEEEDEYEDGFYFDGQRIEANADEVEQRGTRRIK